MTNHERIELNQLADNNNRTSKQNKRFNELIALWNLEQDYLDHQSFVANCPI